MATVSEPKPELKRLAQKVFRFDAVVALLIALISLAGVAVVFLSGAWLSNQVWKPVTGPVAVDVMPIVIRNNDGGGPEGATGDNPELGEGPSLAANADLMAGEQTLSFEQPEAVEVITSVMDAIAAEAPADLLDNPTMATGGAAGRSGGLAGGSGKAGSGYGGGTGEIPPSERWVVFYGNNQTLEEYARQLDYFGIELGVLKGNRLTYVANLATRPVTRPGSPSESRLYFTWQDAGRRIADSQLLNRANVNADDAVVVHFYPQRVEELLAGLERRHKNRKPEDIKITRFGIRPTGAGYEFHVITQSYIK